MPVLCFATHRRKVMLHGVVKRRAELQLRIRAAIHEERDVDEIFKMIDSFNELGKQHGLGDWTYD